MNLYNDWNIEKQKIHRKNKTLTPKIREIWWCSIGINIGNEVYGKGVNFLRPVLIINVINNLFLGIPLTSNLRKSKFKIKIHTSDNKVHCLQFDQIRCLDKKRLVSKMYIISKNKYKKIYKNFNILFKK